MTIRVLIADDQEIIRTGLKMILSAQPDIDVIAEAADGREAVTLARELHPDVCLFDIRMPTMDGIEATRQLAGPDVDVGLGAEDHLQAGSDDVLVVGNEYPDGHGALPVRGSVASMIQPRSGPGPARKVPPRSVARSVMPTSP